MFLPPDRRANHDDFMRRAAARTSGSLGILQTTILSSRQASQLTVFEPMHSIR
jgi:hypothetical protein